MLTCGQTNLAKAVPLILERIGIESCTQLTYHRQNFLYPEDQKDDFSKEIELIQKFVTGKVHHYKDESHQEMFLFDAHFKQDQLNFQNEESGQGRVELLMTLPDPKHLAPFLNCKIVNHEESTHEKKQFRQLTGLDLLYGNRDVLWEEYFFEPCGYSSNGNLGHHYFTIHVTPDGDTPFASFETNFIEKDFSQTLNQLLKIFRPKQALLSKIFTNNVNFGIYTPLTNLNYKQNTQKLMDLTNNRQFSVTSIISKI